jgi:hypothetical protein
MAEYQSLFNIVLGVLLTLLGFLLREQWSIIRGLQEDQSKLREEMPKTYVSKVDNEIHQQRVEDKLDGIQKLLNTLLTQGAR